jgi:hypothetical protein
MSQVHFREELKLETPATYRIRVQGHLDDDWSDRLGGMVITRAYTDNKHPLTILVGHLADQAALSGVLNTLYDLRMPLLSAEIVNENLFEAGRRH